MFMKYFTFILSLISVTMAKPQLITFKDGKIGVNFLGFNAEAGLGGLLTGNAAHGGLSASAGTPFGQRAAAGIGGVNSEGATFGGAFAGATAGEGISARAGLGGRVGGGGALAAEASAGGVSSGVVRTIGSSVNEETPVVIGQENTFDVNTVPQGVTVVQKIKPPKKYSGVNIITDDVNNAESTIALDIDTRFTSTDELQSSSLQKNSSAEAIVAGAAATAASPDTSNLSIVKTKQIVSDISLPSTSQVLTYKTKNLRPLRRRLHAHKQFVPFVYQYQQPSVVEVEKKHQVFAAPVQYSKVKTISAVPVQSAQGSIVKQQTVTAQGQVNAQNFFDGIFNIPISTLRAVNDFLNQGLGQGSLSVRKTVNVQQQH